MTETAVSSAASKGITWAVLGSEALVALYDLRWMLILMVLLIGTDFWWGVYELRIHKKEAVGKAEKEKYNFRFSKAGRRTLNKTIEYLTYMLLGCIIGLAITEPLGWADHITTAAIGMGIGCIFELSSISGHVAAVHGVKVHFDMRKFVIKLIKTKSEDIAEAVDEATKEEEKNDLQEGK